jgi:hypothetical protein
MNYSETEVSWLAGLLDGEGCIYVRFVNVGRYKSNPSGNLEMRVEVHSASCRMIDAVADIYDRMSVGYVRHKPKWQALSTRITHKIQVNRKASVETLLERVLPYLRVKDEEARAVLDFLRAFPHHNDRVSSHQDRETLVLRVRELKQVA